MIDKSIGMVDNHPFSEGDMTTLEHNSTFQEIGEFFDAMIEELIKQAGAAH